MKMTFIDTTEIYIPQREKVVSIYPFTLYTRVHGFHCIYVIHTIMHGHTYPNPIQS